MWPKKLAAVSVSKDDGGVAVGFNLKKAAQVASTLFHVNASYARLLVKPLFILN